MRKPSRFCLPLIRLMLGLLLANALLAASAIAAPKEPPAAKKSEAVWQVIYIGEERIGYSHTTTKDVKSDGKTIVRTVNETKMKFKRFGQSLEFKTTMKTDETKDGDLLTYMFKMKGSPAGSTRTTGKVEGKQLLLESTLAGRVTKKTIAWDSDTKAPAYQDRLIKTPPMKPGETRSFKTFLPELNKVATIKIAADDYRLVKMLDGKTRKRLLKVRILNSALPTTMRAYLDETGEALMTEMDFLGTTMKTYTVDKEIAMQVIAGGELDIAVSTLVHVKRIRNAHRTRKAVYKITTPDEDPSEFLVEGPTQTIKKIDDDTVELTVTKVKEPNGRRSSKTDAEYLKATEFLQSNDRRVVEHARKAAAGETDRWRIAKKMERYVHEKLADKNFSTALASAAEVAKNLEGDCTEHAVLLAAMLRAERVPSRIAVGLVYVPNRAAFGGHMWTEAFIGGQWIPLDATLGEGGIGAAHIKMVESSFADDGPAPVTTFLPLLKVLGKLKIEVVKTE